MFQPYIWWSSSSSCYLRKIYGRRIAEYSRIQSRLTVFMLQSRRLPITKAISLVKDLKCCRKYHLLENQPKKYAFYVRIIRWKSIYCKFHGIMKPEGVCDGLQWYFNDLRLLYNWLNKKIRINYGIALAFKILEMYAVVPSLSWIRM